MDIPPLDLAMRRYLDLIGNGNGSYDIGDYLAWLRRTGQRLPPAFSRSATAGVAP